MKSTNLILTGLCAVALALGVAPAASAKSKPTPTPAASASPMAADAAPKVERALPFHGKVASVDAAAKTFTMTSKKGTSRVFKITDKTEIMKAGATATMTDIVAEEEVRGSFWKKEDGSLEAKKVHLGPLTDAEKEKLHAKKKAMAEPTATP